MMRQFLGDVRAYFTALGAGVIPLVFGVLAGGLWLLQTLQESGAIRLPVQLILPATVWWAIGLIAALWGGFHAFRKEHAKVRALEPSVVVDGVRAVNTHVGGRPIFFLLITNDGPARAANVSVMLRVEFGADSAEENKVPQLIDVPGGGSAELEYESSFTIKENTLEGLQVLGTLTFNSISTPYCHKYRRWMGVRPEGARQFVRCDRDLARVVSVTVGL
jgi:hypothetical protein